MQLTAYIIYAKNEKVYSYFCYKSLFAPVNSREIKNSMTEYQGIMFFHTSKLSCYLPCNASVTFLLPSVT